MAKQDLILIHGTWGNGGNWGEFGVELANRGFRVHSPTARHHGHPGELDLRANAAKIAELGLLDFVADYAELVERMDTPPIIVGHSLGALLAQLLANRVPHRGQILLGAAPAWGMTTFDWAPMALWARYLPHWIAGRPMYPVAKKFWDSHICNATPRELSDPFYDSLCAESGTAYRQMVLWFLDRRRRSKVDYTSADTPVLVVGGELDRCTVPRIGRLTARKYGARGSYVEIPGADHMMNAGAHLPVTMKAIDEWLDRHGLRGG